MVHLITYELAGVRMPAELQRLEAAIKELGDSYAFNKTSWVVQTEKTNQEICERLRQVLRPNDRLLATRIHADWVGVGMATVEAEWLGSRNFASGSDEYIARRTPQHR